MKLKTNLSRCVYAGALVVSIAMLSASSFGQDNKGGGQRGGQSRGGSQARTSGRQQNQARTQQRQSGSQGRSQTRTTQTRTTQSGSMQTRTMHSRTNNGGQQRTRTVQTRTMQSGNGGGSFSGRNGNQGSNYTRPMRMQNGPTGRGISSSSWRNSNPGWNGGYYYHNGGYYYDSGYGYPAIVDNEWGGIAVGLGGFALLSVLNTDPTLVFSGSVGDPYSYNQYQLDLSSSDPELRLRAGYFGRPYFWRNGVRYDRITVVIGGRQSYEFRRH